jgi:regulatory protein
VRDDAFGAAVDALARRDLTSAELEQRLARAGFEPSVRADAVARAVDAGYLDDARVAFERVRHLADRDASDVAIRTELARRGVPEETIDAALASVAPEAERGARLAERLGGGPRAGRALVRKGYREDVVEQVIRRHIAE